ncbi:protein OS-9 homolog [Phoenix dactylifera]|uniref:Protein OS-9 homolog n=1 Tax=Phoenix dactylifera TaxID=42345 RepID=A0A8B7BZV0_PHODC|nr:protein OS-9 homolog [Phoenix dactylifera]
MGAARFFAGFLFFLLLTPHDRFHNVVSADEFFTSTSGVTFGRSSREPKYKIEFHSTESPFHPENGLESVMMSNKEGQSYMCFLPLVEETKTVRSVTPQNSSNALLESDRRIKLKTPDELIDVLKDKCFYRHEGWWSYEFCYEKHLRQLHLEDDKIVQEFVLGLFDPEVTAAFNQNHSDVSMVKDPRSKDASQRYHAHQYTNGTICDLTNQPRETEVRFVCSEPVVIISSIKEISTCKYVITLQCPMLCKHPMFQQERPTWHTIHCNEMPRDIKDSSVKDSLKGTQITIITDDTERHAT